MNKAKVYYPLSHPQKAIWYTEKVYPETSIGNIAATIRIKGEVDFSLLEKAVNIMLEKNDALRLRVTEQNGEPKQYISEYKYVKLDFIDFTGKGIEEVYKWDEKLAKVPMKFIDSDLYHFALVKINGKEGGIFGVFHHLIADAWTMSLAGNQVMEYYCKLKDKEQIVLEDNSSYIDYVLDEEEYKNSDKFKKDAEFWNNKFKGIEELTTLKSRTTKNIGTKAHRKAFIAPAKFTKKLYEYCKENRTSVFSLFLAGLALYINRVTSKEDIIIGTTVLNRSNFKEKNTMGMFISTVPIRLNVDDNLNFSIFEKNVSKEWLGILRHQKYPYDMLLKEIRDRNNLTENVYDIMLSYQNAKLNKDKHSEEYTTRWHFNGHQTESLAIHINDREDEGHLIINYDYLTDLFYAKEIDFIHQHVINILWHALDNPTKEICKLEMVSEREKHKILYEFNNTKADYPKDKTIHQLFEEQVERTPDNVALVFENKSMTYRELNEKANQLARLLREKGVKPDKIVGIMVNRSFEMIIGILGILKAGGAYLPIDPEYPQERIEYMLQDSGTKVILTQKDLKKRFVYNGEIIDIFDAENYQGDNINLQNKSKLDNLAYIIYTSGSTGKPKGVMVEHKNVANFIKGIADRIDFTQDKTIISVTTISFDIFVLETILPLTKGLKVVIANEDEQRIPRLLNDVIIRNNVDMIQTTPSRMQLLISDEASLECFKKLSCIMIGGEAVPKLLIERLRSTTKARIFNMYGPTETTVWSTLKDLTEVEEINIGIPIANTQIYILDKHLNLVPIGMPGELCIGGEGVTRGYYNRPDMTQEKYIPNPFLKDQLIYKTGDIARWYPKGDIEHLGRIDFQVKIRGYRVELAEIESILRKHKDIRESVVVDKVDKYSHKYLCAYVVLTTTLSVSDIKEHLAKELPSYMIPSCFVELDEIPLTPNGKVNRKSLPEPDTNTLLTYEYIAPTNETERKLCQLWAEVLQIEQIGITDNFFDIGGDSLNAVILTTSISKEFNIDFSIKDVYNLLNVKEMARFIIENKDNIISITNDPNLVLLKKGTTKKNIFFLHTGIGEVTGYIPLANEVNNEFNCWGLKADRLENYSPQNIVLEEMAQVYLQKIKSIQKTGPYYFVGWCVGGNIIFELTRLFESMNEQVKLCVILDSIAPCTREYIESFTVKTEHQFIKDLLKNDQLQLPNDMHQTWLAVIDLFNREILDIDKIRPLIPMETARAVPNFETASAQDIVYYINAMRTYSNASAKYVPVGIVNTSAYFIDATKEMRKDNINKWNLYFRNPLKIYSVDADHFTLLRDSQHIAKVAEILNFLLENEID